jgi:putative transcriptional regulator
MTVRAQAGDLLIAPPGMIDERFEEAVIMLTHSMSRGTFALCLNKPTDYMLQDILDEIGVDMNLNFPLYWGGPMSPGTVWMLHDAEWTLGDHSEIINDKWAMTSNIKMFEAMAQGDYPQYFRMMFGYCSWAPHQLEAELDGLSSGGQVNSWLVAQNPEPDWVFETAADDLWTVTTSLSGAQAIDSWL